MSLLDLEEDVSLEFGNMLKKYELVKKDLNQNLLEIDEIIGKKKISFSNSSLKSNMVVGSALIWWNYAVNLLWIQTYYENNNRLRICLR